jgi:hypothetical protein
VLRPPHPDSVQCRFSHHRPGPTSTDYVPEWTAEKWKMLPDINRNYPTVFRLTQGFSGRQELHLPVSRFPVADGDRTKYYWTDKRGRKREKEMPPYFIHDMELACDNIRRFLDSTRSDYITSLLKGSNPLVWQTFRTAMVHTAGGKVCQPKAAHFLVHVLIVECTEPPRDGCVGYLGRCSPHRVSLASMQGLRTVRQTIGGGVTGWRYT